jgi:hypothetical protein
MTEHSRSAERNLYIAAFITACAVLGAVACAAWAGWAVTPHEPPSVPGQPRCGTGEAIVLLFALPFGGMVGAVGGSTLGAILVTALYFGRWFWRHRE